MRLSTRRADDADVIRARLRALLQEGARPRGWLPADDPVDLQSDPADPGTEGCEDHRPEDAGDLDDHEGRLPRGIGRHRAPGTAVRLDPGRRGAWSLWSPGSSARCSWPG